MNRSLLIGATALTILGGTLVATGTASAWPVQTICSEGKTLDFSQGSEETFNAFLAAHPDAFIGTCPVVTTVPATTTPETTTPATTVPETTVPETTVPETTEAATTLPATTLPPDGHECLALDVRNGFPTTGQGSTRGGTATDDGVQPCGPGLDCRADGGTYSYDDVGNGTCAQPEVTADVTQPMAAPAVVAAVTDDTTPPGSLPVTGSDTSRTLALAVLAVAAGAFLVRLARRKGATS